METALRKTESAISHVSFSTLTLDNVKLKQLRMESKETKQRIIGAGLPRTGTLSLWAALKVLGYSPVLHAHQGILGSFSLFPHAVLSNVSLARK